MNGEPLQKGKSNFLSIELNETVKNGFLNNRTIK